MVRLSDITSLKTRLSILKTDGFLDDETGQEPSSWKEISCPHNEKEQPGRCGEALSDQSPATLHSGQAGGFSLHLPHLSMGGFHLQLRSL